MARLAPEEGFELLKDRVQNAVSGLFPIIGRKNTLELQSVAVKDNLDMDDLRSQKQAKLSGRTWSVPVEAVLALKDNATGAVIDKQKMNLLNLPKVTSRFSHIVDGQEYQIDNQWRLKPGVYNMIKQDGALESHFNAAGGFKIHFDPKTRQFTLNYGNSNMPLKPFLHAMGVSDEEVEKSWGKDIVDVNHADSNKELAKFYRASTGDKATKLTPDEAKAHLWETMQKTILRPEVTKFTLGKEYTNVTGHTLLDASDKLLKISRGEAKPDPRDALMFKDLHSIEDFAAERIIKGSREILKKVSNNIDRKAKVRDIVAPEIFNRPIKQMFGKNSLAIVTDQTNPLEMISAQMKTTIMGDGGIKSEHTVSDDAKLIDPSHLGFLDPIHTPEGHATGITLRLPLGVQKIGHDVAVLMYNAKTGKNVKVNPTVAYKSHVVLPDQVTWVDGKPKAIGSHIKISGPANEIYEGSLKDADFVMKDPLQMFSISSNMIPFMPSDHPNRSTMAGRQMEQAISLKHREVPLVQSMAGKTSFDTLVGGFASHRTPVDGVVYKIKPDAIIIKKPNGEKKEVHIYDHFPLNEDKAFLHAEPIVKVGDTVKAQQVIADTNYTKNGTLAIGTNLRAGFMPYKGYNFDDGIVVSESAAKKLTSEHLHRHSLERDIAHILDRRKFQAYMPNALNKAQFDKLDEEGVVKPGTVIMPGDTLIAALRASNDPERREDLELSKLHKSIVKPYKDSSIKWDSDYPGVVKEVVKIGKNVAVHVKTEEQLDVGDKLTGRHGNKGIVTKIVPDHDMPRTADGKHLEILLNPLGVTGRTNLGQVLEVAAAKIAEKTGKPYLVKNFAPGADFHAQVTADLAKHGLSDKEEIIDPLTNKKMGDVLVGPMHVFKLHHQVEKKLSSRAGGTGYAYDKNLIPKGGGPQGAKSLGTLGLYSMLAHGAVANLREMQTLKSDAAQGDQFWSALQAGEMLPTPKPTFAYSKFLGYIRGLGVNVQKTGNNLTLMPMTDKQIVEQSNGEITDPALWVTAKNMKPEIGGLFDPKITGGLEGTKWSHYTLPESLPNPVFESAIIRLLGIKQKEFIGLVGGSLAYDPKTGKIGDSQRIEGGLVGGKAFEHMLGKINVKKDLAAAKTALEKPTLKGTYLDHANSKVKLLQALDKVNMTPVEAYLTKTVPILPPSMRPLPVLPNGTISEEDLNGLYKNLHLSASRYAKMSPLIPDNDSSKVDVRQEMYDGLSALAGIGGYPKQVRRGILDYIHGKKVIDPRTGAKGGSPKEGFFQDQLVERKQDMSMRGTIIPEPSLGLDEVGLPKSAALEVYKPFVIRELRNLLGITPLQAQKKMAEGGEIVDRALEKVISTRPILLKRDPVLHKYGVQAFKPRIVGGKAVQVHPLVTSGFNADFDGDAMGAFVPISVEAVAEAHKMLPSRNLFSPSTGEIMYAPTNESRLGLYGIMQPGKDTDHKFANMQDMESAVRKGDIKLTDRVTVGGMKAGVGRFMVAGALPEGMRRKLLEGSASLDKKAQEAMFTEIGKDHKGDYSESANKLKDLGNMWSTNTAFSIGMKDIAPERHMRDKILAEADAKVHKLTGPHKDQQQIEIYAKATDEMNKHLRAVSESDNNLMLLHNVGMKGGTDTLRQIRAAPMLMSNHKGEIIPTPVRRSYSEGLDVADYWTAISGSRKGIIQKVQSVQEPGYISKQVMNSVMNNLIVDTDCGTTKGIALPVDEKDILDRFTAADIKAGSHIIKAGTLITPEIRSTLRNNNVGKVVVRSPLRCLHGPGICQKSMIPETVVTVKHAGVMHNLSLEALFDLVLSPINTSDCGVEVKIVRGWEISDDGEWVDLERVVRHAREPHKAVLEIRTTHGRTQHLTEDHTAIVWRPRACTCGSLRISIDNRSPDDKAYLYCRDCERSWTVDRESWELAERLEIRADQVMPGDRLRYYPFQKQFRGRKPETPTLNPYWLGLYLAEGSTDRNRDYPRSVSIAQQDNQWRPGMIEACRFVTKNEPHVNETGIVLNDVTLVRELVSVLGGLELCDRKVLPTTWLSWDDSYVGDVVAGLIDGDGHVRERANGSHEVLIGSTSYTLLVQVQDWLSRHSVRADLSCKTQTPEQGDAVKTRKDFFHLTFSANSSMLDRLSRSQKMQGMSACDGKYDLNKQYATVLRVKDVSDRIHCKYVYDVTTHSRKFTANGLLTHNCYGLTENGVLPEKGLNVGVLAGQALGERTTQLALKAFHCSHAKSIVFVRGAHTGVLPITMEALFDLIESPIYMNGTEEVKSVSGWQVWDSEWVNLTHVRRHPPSRPMKLVGDGGLVTICQDNHPLGVWENKVRCTRCGYRKFKNPHKKSRQYCRQCGSPQEAPIEKMGELTFLPPSDLLRNDVYLHRDVSPIMYVRAATTLDVDAYIAGVFLAEGSTAWKKSSKRAVEKPYQVQISQKSGPIQDKIMSRLRKAGWRPRRHKRYVEMDSLKLGTFFNDTFGRYSSNKHLPFDFLGYPTDWLVEMLIGLIDGDGTVLPQSDGPDAINIDSTSFVLVQQIALLCTRLGLVSSIVSTTIRKLTRHQGFAIRIRMTKDAKELLHASEKVRKTTGVSPTRLPEITGYRLVSVVKDVMYTDAYVYDATTETGTLYVSGIKHHNTGGTASSKSALVDDFSHVKNLLAFPKTLPGSATLSELNGKVTKIAPSPAGGHEVTVEGHVHYIPHSLGTPTYGGQPLKVGMEVKKGSPLSEGLVNPHEMLALTGIEPVQLHLASELHSAYAGSGIRRRNHEVVVKALTNLTKIKDPGSADGLIRGDFASTAHVSNINRTMPKGSRPIIHEPILKGVNVLPLEMQEDWIAKLNHENLSETIIDAAQRGWTSSIHSQHPIPAIVYGAEIGKSPEGKVGY